MRLRNVYFYGFGIIPSLGAASAWRVAVYASSCAYEHLSSRWNGAVSLYAYGLSLQCVKRRSGVFDLAGPAVVAVSVSYGGRITYEQLYVSHITIGGFPVSGRGECLGELVPGSGSRYFYVSEDLSCGDGRSSVEFHLQERLNPEDDLFFTF